MTKTELNQLIIKTCDEQGAKAIGIALDTFFEEKSATESPTVTELVPKNPEAHKRALAAVEFLCFDVSIDKHSEAGALISKLVDAIQIYEKAQGW